MDARPSEGLQRVWSDGAADQTDVTTIGSQLKQLFPTVELATALTLAEGVINDTLINCDLHHSCAPL